MPEASSSRLRHQGLFFVGLATVVVLLPFPNIFGIALDAAILAIAYPIVGARMSLLLVFVYNFNPLKMNGAITIYYTFAGVFSAWTDLPVPVITATIVGIMVLATVWEYVVIRRLSTVLWRVLVVHDPRMRTFSERATRLR